MEHLPTIGVFITIITAVLGLCRYVGHKLRTRKGQPTPLIYKRLKDYWNGICPHCKTHIGIDIIEHRLSKKRFGICGACGKRFNPEEAECIERRDSTGKVILEKH